MSWASDDEDHVGGGDRSGHASHEPSPAMRPVAPPSQPTGGDYRRSAEQGQRSEVQGQRDGGYRREGGYQRREGGDREGGFQRREGGYQRREGGDREGGYQRREGGYRREGGDREGGYQRRDDREGYQRRDGGDRRPRGEFEERPQRPVPDAPPYTAFLGGLDYQATKDDLFEFFNGLKIENVRLQTDRDGQPKGFGYVVFAEADDLRNALTLNGQELRGRKVRIDVAESRPERPERTGGFGDRRHSGDRERSDRPAETLERTRLAIQPRTTPVEPLSSPSQTTPTEPVKKSNPFGGARPVDSSRQRDIEEKASQRTVAPKREEKKEDKPVYRPPGRQDGAAPKRDSAPIRKDAEAPHSGGKPAPTSQPRKKESQAAVTNKFSALSMDGDSDS